MPTERKVSIKLEITEDCPHNPESLHRCLSRCEHPTKKGTQIDVIYTTEGDHPTGQVWDIGTSRYSRQSNAGRVRMTLHQKAAKLGSVDQGRMYEELRKICLALEEVVL
ncbi:hypothetical protein LTR36_005288 [Oleoguttula mirabilis]|uniref:Uncharacterized protein n=1 Tax=Oleoguttula mirabilis TaxID=1507867 RepID=A0AAV9JFR8_9PEZI|nr:hypothetical protein LTR36_005288 [Oleoguttula mirabilis]